MEFNLKYNELVVGQYYTTSYPAQGLYTFQFGYELWYSHIYLDIQRKSSRFFPDNGFNEFRLATTNEVKHFYDNPLKFEELKMKEEIGLL